MCMASTENKPNDFEEGRGRGRGGEKKKVESKKKIGRNKGGKFPRTKKDGRKEGWGKINSRQYVERFLHVSGYETGNENSRHPRGGVDDLSSVGGCATQGRVYIQGRRPSSRTEEGFIGLFMGRINAPVTRICMELVP